jgi:hypothetical protein
MIRPVGTNGYCGGVRRERALVRVGVLYALPDTQPGHARIQAAYDALLTIEDERVSFDVHTLD